MSHGNNKGSGLHRKPGEWMQIARGRSHKKRFVVATRAPYLSLSDVGSAAYRRLLAKWK